MAVLIDGREGAVRFIGSTQFAPGEWIGIDLVEACLFLLGSFIRIDFSYIHMHQLERMMAPWTMCGTSRALPVTACSYHAKRSYRQRHKSPKRRLSSAHRHLQRLALHARFRDQQVPSLRPPPPSHPWGGLSASPRSRDKHLRHHSAAQHQR